MSSYEDRMAEKYNFLKKENTDHKSEDNVSEEKTVENQQKNVEIPEEGSLLVPLDAWIPVNCIAFGVPYMTCIRKHSLCP